MSSKQFTSRPYTWEDENGNKQTIASTEDVLRVMFSGKRWEELSAQQKISASVMCNYINPSNCYPLPEFDVSDTVLLDPNGPDPFNEEVGLANRFSGEFNAAANELIKAQGLFTNKNQDSQGSNQEDEHEENAVDAMLEKFNEIALKNITEYCAANGINLPEGIKDPSVILIEAMRKVAREEINFSKKENVDRLVDDAVYATCVTMNIALDSVGLLRNKGKMTNKMEFAQYSVAFQKLYKVISGQYKEEMAGVRSEVAEGINQSPWKKYSDEELLALAEKNMPTEELNENIFDSWMDRMDNSKTNLKY